MTEKAKSKTKDDLKQENKELKKTINAYEEEIAKLLSQKEGTASDQYVERLEMICLSFSPYRNAYKSAILRRMAAVDVGVTINLLGRIIDVCDEIHDREDKKRGKQAAEEQEEKQDL